MVTSVPTGAMFGVTVVTVTAVHPARIFIV